MAAGAALILFSTLFRGTTPLFLFDYGTSGVFFDQGARVLAGQVMYRDFFEFVGPGVVYLHALVMLVTGAGIRGLTWALVLEGVVLALLIHALACAVCGPRWRLLPPAVFVVLVYAPYVLGDHKWPALVCALAALLVLAGGKGVPSMTVGGALLGLSALFTQDLGAGVMLGVVAYLAWHRPRVRPLLPLLLGWAAPVATVFAFFAWKAGARTVVYDCLLYPLQRYPPMNLWYLDLVPSLRTLPRELAQGVLGLAGVLAGILTLVESRRPDGEGPGAGNAGLVSAGGLGMAVAMSHRALYPMGLAMQGCVLLPVLARLLERWRRGSRAWRRAATAILLILAAGLAHGSIGLVIWRQAFQTMTREAHRAGAVWTLEPMPELSWIEANTSPGEGTFLMPAKGGHYFLSRTRNVTSFPYLLEGQNTIEHGRKALAEIEAARPRVGVWDQRPWPRTTPQSAGPLRFLYEGLLRSYDAETLPSGVVLLRRKER